MPYDASQLEDGRCPWCAQVLTERKIYGKYSESECENPECDNGYYYDGSPPNVHFG